MNADQPTSALFTIRPCHLADEPGALSVCLQTGDAGQDASEQFDDPNVLGYRYVSPYIHFSPELAFVLEDMDKHICGYVLATLESDQFYQRYVNEWLPKMKIRYPTVPSIETTSKDREIIGNFHNETLESFKLFEDYPSHLHIDLLPKAQNLGYGRKMIARIEEELKQRGSKGVHLGMAPTNERALGFYKKLGFHVLEEDADTLWLGKKL